MKYTIEELKTAVCKSQSVCQVLKLLNLKPAGGNYQTLKNRFRTLNIDTSHFIGKTFNRGKTWVAFPIERYLSNEIPISSHKLKIRLIKEGKLQPICASCKLIEWLGEPIPLELDHKNGIHDDNIFSNLQLLCPNCHAKTPTYRGKNIKRTLTVQRHSHPCTNRCVSCSIPITRQATRCKKCVAAGRSTKIKWPSPEDLYAMVQRTSYCTVAKSLGVSDTAVRNHLKCGTLGGV